MNITAESVKQLRERTGAGMMECKKALVEANGDLEAAAEIMRKFRQNTANVLSEEKAQRVIDTILHVETLASTRDLAQMLAG